MRGVGRQPGWQVERSLGGGSAEGKQKGAPLPSKMPVSEESVRMDDTAAGAGRCGPAAQSWVLHLPCWRAEDAGKPQTDVVKVQ